MDARRAWHIPDCRYDGGEYRAEGCTRHVSGLYNLVWSLSNAFSPLVGGWILNAFGSHVLWTCCTVMFVIVAIGFYVTRGPRERAAARNLAMEEL